MQNKDPKTLPLEDEFEESEPDPDLFGTDDLIGLDEIEDLAGEKEEL